MNFWRPRNYKDIHNIWNEETLDYTKKVRFSFSNKIYIQIDRVAFFIVDIYAKWTYKNLQSPGVAMVHFLVL